MNGRYESFTVRVWARGDEIVRGEVTHVLTGLSKRFADLDVLSNFLAGQIAKGDGEPPVYQLRAENRSEDLADPGAKVPEGGRHDTS